MEGEQKTNKDSKTGTKKPEGNKINRITFEDDSPKKSEANKMSNRISFKDGPANRRALNGSRNRGSKFVTSRRIRNRKPRRNVRLKKILKDKREKRILERADKMKGMENGTDEKDDENKVGTDLDIYVELKKKEEEELRSQAVNLKDYIEVPGSEVYGGTYTRVVIIGDAFLSNYKKLWPEKSNVKPYFLYKNKLSIHELYLKFHDHAYLKNSEKILVLFILGLHDFTEYGFFMKASCTGNHLFTEFIKDLKVLDSWLFVKKMSEIKESFEKDGALSILFSYFPNLQNVRDLREIFNTSEEDIPNCTCLCHKLGEVSGKHVETDFNEVNKIRMQRAMTKQVNTLKGKGVFEYLPPTVSFVNGKWRLARAIEKTEEDVCVLNCLLNEFIFDVEYVDVLDQTQVDNIKEQVAFMRGRIIKSRITNTKFRIVVLGDKWLDCIACQWRSHRRVCPFYYFADNLTLNDLRQAIVSLIKKDEIGLVITAIPSGELFTMKRSSKCKDHDSLAFPVPNANILENPANYAYKLIEKMNSFLQEIKQLRRYCGVVFMTCYPVQFSSYYEHLTEVHATAVGEEAHSESGSGSPIDVDFSNFDTKVSQCTDVINQYIRTSNEVQKLPVCDVAEVVKSSDEIYAFPTFVEKKFPPRPLGKKLFKNVKAYIGSLYDMCVARKFSFTQTEEYLKRQSKRKYFEELRKAQKLEARTMTANLDNEQRSNKRANIDVDMFEANKRPKPSILGSNAKLNLLRQESNNSFQPQNVPANIPHLSRSFNNNGPLQPFMVAAAAAAAAVATAPRIPRLGVGEDRAPVNFIRSLASMDDRPIRRVPLRDSDAMPFGNQRSLAGFPRSPTRAGNMEIPVRNVRDIPLMSLGRNPDNAMRIRREPPLIQRTNNLNNIRVIGERPLISHALREEPIRMGRDRPLIPGGPIRNW